MNLSSNCNYSKSIGFCMLRRLVEAIARTHQFKICIYYLLLLDSINIISNLDFKINNKEMNYIYKCFIVELKIISFNILIFTFNLVSAIIHSLQSHVVNYNTLYNRNNKHIS